MCAALSITQSLKFSIIESQYFLAPCAALALFSASVLLEFPSMHRHNAWEQIAAHPFLFLAAGTLGVGVTFLSFLVVQMTNSGTYADKGKRAWPLRGEMGRLTTPHTHTLIPHTHSHTQGARHGPQRHASARVGLPVRRDRHPDAVFRVPLLARGLHGLQLLQDAQALILREKDG